VKEVIMLIDQQGNITVEAFGFKGESCLKATEWLEKLGDKQEVKFKPEYYQKEVNHQRARRY